MCSIRWILTNVADGRKQKSIYPKEATASPALSNEAFFASLIIDVFEGRDVATCDISGAYLRALKLDKAMYGCVRSALLWYQTFVNVLMIMGFKVNPHDECVANMIINDSQCTIAWYVDESSWDYPSI